MIQNQWIDIYAGGPGSGRRPEGGTKEKSVDKLAKKVAPYTGYLEKFAKHGIHADETVEAGGPGSGRHPSEGFFKTWTRNGKKGIVHEAFPGSGSSLHIVGNDRKHGSMIRPPEIKSLLKAGVFEQVPGGYRFVPVDNDKVRVPREED